MAIEDEPDLAWELVNPDGIDMFIIGDRVIL